MPDYTTLDKAILRAIAEHPEPNTFALQVACQAELAEIRREDIRRTKYQIIKERIDQLRCRRKILWDGPRRVWALAHGKAKEVTP